MPDIDRKSLSERDITDVEAHLAAAAPPPSVSSVPLTTRSAPPALDRWMPNGTTKLAPPVNHVFVDFENVQEIDLAVVGNQTVSFTMLLGPQQTKMKVTVVEKLLEHAASVQFVRLVSTGPNALDFTLSYYIGRAAATDPNGFFHIISKDKGFDPLIEHLRSKHIRACRHDDFTALRFSGSAKPQSTTPPPPAASVKVQTKPRALPPIASELEMRVLDRLRKPSTQRPRTKEKLVSYLLHDVAADKVSALIENLSQAGHLFIDDKGAVKYRLDAR
jgi:hypothetical protein